MRLLPLRPCKELFKIIVEGHSELCIHAAAVLKIHQLQREV